MLHVIRFREKGESAKQEVLEEPNKMLHLRIQVKIRISRMIKINIKSVKKMPRDKMHC